MILRLQSNVDQLAPRESSPAPDKLTCRNPFVLAAGEVLPQFRRPDIQKLQVRRRLPVMLYTTPEISFEPEIPLRQRSPTRLLIRRHLLKDRRSSPRQCPQAPVYRIRRPLLPIQIVIVLLPISPHTAKSDRMRSPPYASPYPAPHTCSPQTPSAEVEEKVRIVLNQKRQSLHIDVSVSP